VTILLVTHNGQRQIVRDVPEGSSIEGGVEVDAATADTVEAELAQACAETLAIVESAVEAAKASARAKLRALGLTDAEIEAITA
jgi:hypothetical protein